MRAIVYRSYGPPDVLRLEEVEKPAAGDGEVLIKIRAASLNPLDWKLMKGKPYGMRLFFGLRGPRNTRPGRDVAGVVESVGVGVTRFKPGDEVFGACRGSLAEYASAKETALALKPEGVSFEQAAAVPVAGLTALQCVRDKGKVSAGQKVLINGASGGVGTFAVQMARAFGAEVTGVCSTRNVEMVRSLGAERVVDYTREDFTEGPARYDLVVDCVGHRSPSDFGRVLKPGGACLVVGARDTRWMLVFIASLVKLLALSLFTRRKFAPVMARLNADDLSFIAGLIAGGKVTPVIDRRYRLSETPEAVGYVQQGHARGKVIISVGQDGAA